jgi:thiamine pyrophosphate-dependent acetolactate synthase large subunit-like protein
MEISVPDPAGFVYTTDFGTVGLGIGAGIGAALARTDRLTVTVVGDGGLMMSLADLDTAVRQRLPIVFVVMNDGGFGAEVHHLRHRDLPIDAAAYANPDFAAVARSLGLHAVSAASEADMPAVDSALGGLDGPLLVDVKLAHDDPAEYFAREWSTAQVTEPAR